MTDTGKEETETNQESGSAFAVVFAASSPEAPQAVDEPAESRRGEEPDWTELCQSVSWSSVSRNQARHTVAPAPPPAELVQGAPSESVEGAARAVLPIPVEAFEAWMQAEDPQPEVSQPEGRAVTSVAEFAPPFMPSEIPVSALPVTGTVTEDSRTEAEGPAGRVDEAVRPAPASLRTKTAQKPVSRVKSRGARAGMKLDIPVTDIPVPGIVSEVVVLTSQALRGWGFGGADSGGRRSPAVHPIAARRAVPPAGKGTRNPARAPAETAPSPSVRPAPPRPSGLPFSRVAEAVEREMGLAARWVTIIGSGLAKRAQQAMDTAAARLRAGRR
ncbi:hypothetical protein CCP1ISM_10035 [Azospirillaceae bacterium]|nr:hypothetical protein MTCCP1_00039 [uncultured bacterium]